MYPSFRFSPWIPCLLALWSCGSSEPEPTTVEVTPPPPEPGLIGSPPRHAVVIVVDTLRADIRRDVQTPRIDALAKRGGQVERAWSAGTWTVPSVISMFTGASVREHGWDLPTGKIGRYPPVPELPTIAEVLQDTGFTTHGLYSNSYLAEELGFGRGFDEWGRTVDSAMAARFQKIVDRTWSDGKRHFAYLHILGPHSPLRPTEEAQNRWSVSPEWIDAKRGFGIGVAKRNRPEGARQAYAQAYRAVVEDIDTLVGQLVDGLGEHRESTLVVVTSDHGELLGEHDIAGHGSWVWEPLTHVPLVVDGIKDLPQSLGTASLPAILTWALKVDHDWPTPAWQSSPIASQREGKLALTLDGVQKAIWDEQELPMVYDLQADPGEETSSSDDGALTEARRVWEETTPAGTLAAITVELPESTQEELKSLGYLEQ